MGERITIPEEAWALLISEPSVEETERAAALIVAAELERLASGFDGAAQEFNKQAEEDRERDRKLNLTGKSIGFERVAIDLWNRARELRVGSLTHKGEERDE